MAAMNATRKKPRAVEMLRRRSVLLAIRNTTAMDSARPNAKCQVAAESLLRVRQGDVRVDSAVHDVAIHTGDVGGRVRVLLVHVLGWHGAVAYLVHFPTSDGADARQDHAVADLVFLD